MAGGNGRVNVEVGFSVDKSGLTQMQSLFQQIANSAKQPGVNLTTELQKAASTANTLDQILEKTFNIELGTLNVTKFPLTGFPFSSTIRTLNFAPSL